jgi:hypothetical protein
MPVANVIAGPVWTLQRRTFAAAASAACTSTQTVGGGLQRFVAKGFVAKGKLAGSTLWGAVPINRPCRVLCAFDLREPLNLPILAV